MLCVDSQCELLLHWCQIVLSTKNECVKRRGEGLLKCFHYKNNKQHVLSVLLCSLM